MFANHSIFGHTNGDNFSGRSLLGTGILSIFASAALASELSSRPGFVMITDRNGQLTDIVNLDAYSPIDILGNDVVYDINDTIAVRSNDQTQAINKKVLQMLLGVPTIDKAIRKLDKAAAIKQTGSTWSASTQSNGDVLFSRIGAGSITKVVLLSNIGKKSITKITDNTLAVKLDATTFATVTQSVYSATTTVTIWTKDTLAKISRSPKVMDSVRRHLHAMNSPIAPMTASNMSDTIEPTAEQVFPTPAGAPTKHVVRQSEPVAA